MGQVAKTATPTPAPTEAPASTIEPSPKADQSKAAVGGLALLSHLVGREEEGGSDTFKMDLFGGNDGDDRFSCSPITWLTYDDSFVTAAVPMSTSKEHGASAIHIDTNEAHKANAELSKIRGYLDADDEATGSTNPEEDDLLDLLDSA